MAGTHLSPVFIVGVGRSGTSLLQSMLHAHPSIAFLPETHFFRHYIARRFIRWSWELADPQAFYSNLMSDDDFQRVDISSNDIYTLCSNNRGAFSVVDVYIRLLRLYKDREEASIVGEKDPRLVDYIPKLKEIFPEAKIVHIVRDPRDVLLSRKNADWSAARPDWLQVLTYRAQIKRGRKQGRRFFGSNYEELRYEDLLSAPEKTLQKLSEHIGVPYSDAMLAFQSSAEELVHENEHSWKKETTGPLLRDNTGKWRKGLTPWQVCLIEWVCNEAFDWFGYERAALIEEVTPARRAALRLAPLASTIFEYLYAVACRFR